jgi:hypothetical protein
VRSFVSRTRLQKFLKWVCFTQLALRLLLARKTGGSAVAITAALARPPYRAFPHPCRCSSFVREVRTTGVRDDGEVSAAVPSDSYGEIVEIVEIAEA